MATSADAPPIDLERLAESNPTWVLEIDDEGGVRVGPSDLLGSNPRTGGTVTLLPGDWEPGPGRRLARRHVVESATEFDVVYEHFDGYDGLWHAGGLNRIVWSREPIPRRVGVTATSEPARRWVHVRYVLRHLNAASLFVRQAREPFHAVIGALPASRGGGGILIHGSSGSGKTYLWQMLRDAGIVTGMPEDDCALVGPDWDALCLLPERDVVVASTRVPIRAIVTLAGDDDEPARIDGSAFLAQAGRTWVCWPIAWLPGGELRPVPPTLPPPAIPVLRVGQCRATSATLDVIDSLAGG
jgi:hypothetical protein